MTDTETTHATKTTHAQRGPREKATVAGRLELARKHGDLERIETLEDLEVLKGRLEATVLSGAEWAIAKVREDLGVRFAEELAALDAYHDADDALRAAVAKRDDELIAVLDGANPKEEAAKLAGAVRKAEAKRITAIRGLREYSVGLDLYRELLHTLPRPRTIDSQRETRDQDERRNADRPKGNGNGRRNQQVPKGQAAPIRGGIAAGREQRNRERVAREAKAAEARRKADEAARCNEANAVAAFLVWGATPTASETPKGPAVERLEFEGLGGLTPNGVFYMPDDPTPAASAKLS